MYRCSCRKYYTPASSGDFTCIDTVFVAVSFEFILSTCVASVVNVAKLLHVMGMVVLTRIQLYGNTFIDATEYQSKAIKTYELVGMAFLIVNGKI